MPQKITDKGLKSNEDFMDDSSSELSYCDD